MDDDSWFHLDHILEYLQSLDTPQVVAGCLIRSQYNLHLTWYWGGFGVILSKAALERLRKPIHCLDDMGEFVKHACHQLQQNVVGEERFFRPGMSVVDLIYAYSSQQPYINYTQWNPGYCMHSDMALAYFFNWYHIPEQAQTTEKNDSQSTRPPHYDRIRAYQGTSVHRTKKLDGKVYKSYGSCRHKTREQCTVDSHLCHYIPKEHMLKLFEQVYAATPQKYLDQPKVDTSW